MFFIGLKKYVKFWLLDPQSGRKWLLMLEFLKGEMQSFQLFCSTDLSRCYWFPPNTVLVISPAAEVVCSWKGARTACRWHSGKQEEQSVELLERAHRERAGCSSPAGHSPLSPWIEQHKAGDHKAGKGQWKIHKGWKVRKLISNVILEKSQGQLVTSCTQ